MLGGNYRPVPLGPDFSYDVDALIETAVGERARLVILNSPNNPTGSALPDGAVERLLEETGALVVCDEAYQEFGGPTALPLLRHSSRVVVLRTFSKALSMAGLRFGLALAHPAVARELAKGKLPYNINVVTLAAAAAALRHGDELAARVRLIVEQRDRLVSRLSALSALAVYPSAANFVLIRCLRHPAREVFRRLLEEHGILVRDVSGASELSQCLRISVGTAEDVDAVVDGLAAIVGERAVTRRDVRVSNIPARRPARIEVTMPRIGEIRRTTKETDLHVVVSLDGSGASTVHTGIGFFDHMLDAFARHALLDLTVEAQGDLHVDGHHTVEDTGIAIGMALERALGDRAGIRRYADALVPARRSAGPRGRGRVGPAVPVLRHRHSQVAAAGRLRCLPHARILPRGRAQRGAHRPHGPDPRRQSAPHRGGGVQGIRAGARRRDEHRSQGRGRAVDERRLVIVVVDYGVNNLASVVRALAAGGHTATLASDPDVVRRRTTS